MSLDGQAARNVGGYAMAALLVALGVMSVGLLVAMPAWRTLVQRDKEEELIFRGTQYARAVGLYQRKFGAAFPPTIDLLVNQKFLRKKYKDPVTKDGEFQILYQGSLAASQPGLRTGQQGQAGQPGSGGAGSSGGRQPAGSGGTSTFTQTRSSGFSSPGSSGSTGGVAGPQGGIVGVVSKSAGKSVRLYNGRNHYNEWQFVYVPLQAQPGGGVPGMPGMMPGGQRGPGRGQPGPFTPGVGPRGQRGGGADRMGEFGPGGQGRPGGQGGLAGPRGQAPIRPPG